MTDLNYKCPHCGEDLDKKAKVCYNCGSDERTGWSADTYLDGIDLNDPEEYEELKENEFGKKTGSKQKWVTITAGIIVVVFIALFVNFR
jgi:uncharacterized membrane protein YvbJ